MGVILNILPKTLVIGDPDKNYSFSNAVEASSGNIRATSGTMQNPANVATSGPTRSETSPGGSSLVDSGIHLEVTGPAPSGNQNNTTNPVDSGGNGSAENIGSDTGFSAGGSFGGGGGGGGIDTAAEETAKNLPATKPKKPIWPWLLVAGAAVAIIYYSSKKGKGKSIETI